MNDILLEKVNPLNSNNPVNLTKEVTIPTKGHILYFYEEVSKYVDNAVSYIRTGVELGHHMIIIENDNIYQLIKKKVIELITEEVYARHVHYVENHVFYRTHGDFHYDTIINDFKKILEPYFQSELTVRTWAHVQWGDQDNIVEKLEKFERAADYNVTGMKLVSVCAYDSNAAPASLLTMMMKSHAFFMTDDELVRSSLYHNR